MKLQRQNIKMTLMAALLALAIPSSYAFAQCANPEGEGLIAHWTLDETSGSTINDSAGSFNGSVQGGLNTTTDSTTGQLGTALTFNGTSDYITLADIDFAQGGFTFTAWSKTSASAFSRMVSKFNHGAEQFGMFNNGSGNAVSCGLHDGSNWAGSDIDGATVGKTFNDGQWHFVACVVDDQNITTYADGFWGAPAAHDNGFGLNNNLWVVGRQGDASATEYFAGDIDDVRIYNRALSTKELDAIYDARSTSTSTAGTLVYDARYSRMMYCDGTNWVHAGIGPYNPNAVEFDGTNDYLNYSSLLSGVSNDSKFTISAWVYSNAALSSGQRYIFNTDWTNRFSFHYNSSAGDSFQVNAKDASNTERLDFRCDAEGIQEDKWYHVLMSVDLTDSNKASCYLNDVEGHNSSVYDTANPTLDFTHTTNVFGRFNTSTNTSLYWNGYMSDVWIDFGTYIDFSVEANRRKFISEQGMPMYLGPDGSIPTGAAPDIYLTGDTANWHTNKAAGGGFTENGELTTAPIQPADSTIAAGQVTASANLVGHWKLDETIGTTAADSSGNGNNGTLQGGMTAAADTVSGAVNTGFNFDGNNDYINVANESNFDFTTSFSVAAWVRVASFGGGGYRTLIDKGGDWTIEQNVSNSNLRIVVSGLANGALGGGDIEDGQWHHVVFVYDSDADDLIAYTDGVFSASQTNAGAGPPTTNNDNVNIGRNMYNGRYWPGDIDDVRIYDKPLSAEEVAAIYVEHNKRTGVMRYNSDFNVMEYFNGVEWVAMGPRGGAAPSTSGLVAYWKFDEGSGTSAADSSTNSNTGTLVDSSSNGSVSWDANGVIGSAIDFTAEYGDYFSVANDASINLTGQFSIAFWMKNHDTVAGGFDVLGKIDSGLDRWQYSVQTYGDEITLFYCNPTNAQCGAGGSYRDTTTTAANLPEDEWVHYVITYDDTGNVINFYFDGALYVGGKTSLGGNSAETASVQSTTVPLHIGHSGYVTSETDATIDEVMLYNRVLTATEVADIYSYGLSGGYTIGSGGCSNPARDEGVMIYNTGSNALQYCNGENWIGVGK